MLMNRGRAHKFMAERGLDGLLFRNPDTVTYASDFHNYGAGMPSRPFAAVMFRDESVAPLLVIPSVDFRLAKELSWIQDVKAYVRAEKASDRDRDFYPDFFTALTAGLEERRATGARLGYEEGYVPTVFFEQMRKALPRVSWVPAGDTVARIRAVKTPEEIGYLRRAAEIGVKAHDGFRQALRIGVTEHDLAVGAKVTMAREGADTVSFMFLSSGPTAGYSHNPFPRTTPLQRGDFVRVDMGCVYRSYRSDFCRSFVLGRATARQHEVYRALDEGCTAIGGELKPGVSCIDLYNWGFKFMNERLPGYAREFLGHGIGIGAHEEPRLHEGNPMVLEPGMVVCIEHSYYLDGARFHFEDTFLIEETGPDCWTTELSRDLEVPV